VPESFLRMSPERIQRLLFVAVTRATNWVYLSTNVGKELPLLQALQPLGNERALTVESAHDRTPPATGSMPGTPPKTDHLDFL